MIESREIDRLRQFHATHFPGQPVPNVDCSPRQSAEEAPPAKVNDLDNDDGLGYYGDGVKRTLTAEQVEMFRHSEIQRLLNERRATREKEEKQAGRKDREARRNRAARPPKQHFDDQPKQADLSIDSLMYDDQPAPEERRPKQFLWPQLG
jgi:hypothetical protein